MLHILIQYNLHYFPFPAAPFRHRSNDPIAFEENSYPYYGGYRGQFLQVHSPRDSPANMVLLSSASPGNPKRISTTLNSDLVRNSAVMSTFEQDFNRIQIAAARLVAIQELAKRKGAFSAEDNRVYAESLMELGQAAQNLAKLQQSGKIKDFSLLLQPEGGMPQKQPLYPANTGVNVEQSLGEQKVDEVTEQHLSDDDFLPPNTEDPYEDTSDSVAITAPKKDASVAEAKPIGLSIAGEGGVASSKPNAVALSGRNGLAVSAPKATAIAGVSAEEAAAFSVSLPNRHHLVIKNGQVANRLPQRPVYDDYDYSDVPVRSVSRDAASPSNAEIAKKPKPHGSNGGIAAGDPFVNKWKTLIAEDYAAAGRNANLRNVQAQSQVKPMKAANKFLLRANDGQTYYVF